MKEEMSATTGKMKRKREKINTALSEDELEQKLSSHLADERCKRKKHKKKKHKFRDDETFPEPPLVEGKKKNKPKLKKHIIDMNSKTDNDVLSEVSQDDTSNSKKKKNKNKRLESLVPLTDSKQNMKESKKVSHSEIVSGSLSESDETDKDLKKNKGRKNSDGSLEINTTKDHKKHRKFQDKLGDSTNPVEICNNTGAANEGNDIHFCEQVSSKNKRKKHSKDGYDLETTDDTKNHLQSELQVEKPKPKKWKRHSKEFIPETEDDIQNTVLPSSSLNKTQKNTTKDHKKHRKSQDKLCDSTNSVEICNNSGAENEGNDIHFCEQVSSKNKRKKHSKDRYDLETTDDTKNHLQSELQVEESKPKKWKRHSKEFIPETEDDIQNAVLPSSNLNKTKKKKSKSRETNDFKDSSGSACKLSKDKKETKCEKKKKSKDKTEFSASGSSTEIPYVTNDSATLHAVQGQWQGNLFESSERQDKFIRLLGGMKKPGPNDDKGTEPKKSLFAFEDKTKKKGLFGSLASLSTTNNSIGGKTAMSISAAANLNKHLENDFNKAMSLRLSGKRGTGFGFTLDPAEGKKFHIDINKSKSIKFDN